MQFIAHDYFIITKDEGIQLCKGYIFNYKGIVFGIDRRGKNTWVVTDIKTGLKILEVEKRKDCTEKILDIHLESIKEVHKQLYIKYGNKLFIIGNQDILNLYGGEEK